MDMSLTLSLPKVNAEAILRQNEWSKEVVLENWRRDPIETCSMAGIQPPQPPGRLSHFLVHSRLNPFKNVALSTHYISLSYMKLFEGIEAQCDMRCPSSTETNFLLTSFLHLHVTCSDVVFHHNHHHQYYQEGFYNNSKRRKQFLL